MEAISASRDNKYAATGYLVHCMARPFTESSAKHASDMPSTDPPRKRVRGVGGALPQLQLAPGVAVQVLAMPANEQGDECD